MISITETKCIDCRFLDAESNKCTAAQNGSPLRKCLIGLVTEELEKIAKSKPEKILEVGCGSWGFIKDFAQENKIQYYGVDPAEIDSNGVPSVRTHAGTADELPYPDETFDYLISNQTIEHWHEFGTTFYSGVAEAIRVTKTGGTISINFPISFHGHYVFKNEIIDSIASLFPKKYFAKLTLTIRRKSSNPLALFHHEGMEKPAYIGQLKGIKTNNATSLNLFINYTTRGKLHLINPLPLIKYKIKRLRGKATLHQAPTT